MAELVVALDFGTADEALDCARSLKGTVNWVKVGLELFCSSGPEIIPRLKEMDFSVFCDLKFHDIPHTVAGAVRSISAHGADMINVHASGGDRMLEAAREALVTVPKEQRPLLFAVTVLTSISDEEAQDIFGRAAAPMAETLAKKAHGCGLDGVVCSAQEVVAIKKNTASDFLCLTPGIRPAGDSGSDDQRRVVTPGQAVANGSDFLVAGRPITRAASPVDAAREFIRQMNS